MQFLNCIHILCPSNLRQFSVDTPMILLCNFEECPPNVHRFGGDSMDIQWRFDEDDMEKQRRTNGDATEKKRSINGQMAEKIPKIRRRKI
ncbi:MAG: hypothetical protein J5663_07730 [Bacteroidaceae bacterium]|nr:hypothetical protein [Bacteroidaceae bacterium]